MHIIESNYKKPIKVLNDIFFSIIDHYSNLIVVLSPYGRALPATFSQAEDGDVQREVLRTFPGTGRSGAWAASIDIGAAKFTNVKMGM